MNMNLTRSNLSVDVEQVVIDYVSTFVFPVICVYGIATNVLSAVVYSDGLYTQLNKLRVYLRAVSVNYAFGLFVLMFSALTRCGHLCGHFSHSYAAKFYELYFLYYLANVIYMFSFFVHLHISVFVYSTLCKKTSGKKECLTSAQRLSLFLILSVIYAMPGVFNRQITRSTDNYTYVIVHSKDDSKLSKRLSFFVMNFLKVLILLMVVLNVILVVKLQYYRRMYRHNMALAWKSKSRKKDVVLVVWMSFLYISSHLTYWLTHTLTDYGSKTYTRLKLFHDCFSTFLFGSYFFVFYFTSFVFRKIFKKNIHIKVNFK